MEIREEFISAACNRTYNCLELFENTLIYAANKAIAIYNIQEARLEQTVVSHTNRITCIRFVKRTNQEWVLSSDLDGQLVLWQRLLTNEKENLQPQIIRNGDSKCAVRVCDGIKISDTDVVVGYITSLSKVALLRLSLPFPSEKEFSGHQEIDLKQSMALDLVFHLLESDGTVVMAAGMESGSVHLFASSKSSIDTFHKVCALKKHEDWVRCIAFRDGGDGTTLMATGGQDSFIAIWRFVEPTNEMRVDDFEFQVQQFEKCKILFDSMIMGHEGWVNSLAWNSAGELISCSSDQSIIIWQNSGDIWTEKARFGTVGGQTPGGFGAKFSDTTVATCGFQGSIQIWTKQKDDWVVNPSITGHFNSVTDLDYHPNGIMLTTTSLDQTTRIFAPWGPDRWHEIARPQIHGHDIFAIKFCQDFLISGAEEKILRAFQPTEIFIHTLDDTSEISVTFEQYSPSATLPALGLSNQTGSSDTNDILETVETRLDEDFLRSHTLWPEVSKLYGHVYEIACIATCKKHSLIASASQSSKPQFSGIILWCAKTWKNLGDFKFHKLNVNDMEFNQEGDRLLSVSRDRTWALWKVFVSTETSQFSLKMMESGGVHTRALMVGTWTPNFYSFATGGRDKKLIVWKASADAGDGIDKKFEPTTTHTFSHPVSAVAINEDHILAAGLESGCLILFKLSLEVPGAGVLQLLLKLENGLAHHDTISRLKFNPKNKSQLASAGSDNLVKIYKLCSRNSSS